MADVQLTATRIDALMLPANFSRAYQMYVLQQGADLEALAGKANSAGRDATTAQDQNAKQDEQIAGHAQQLKKLSGDYVSLSTTSPQVVASSLGATAFTVNGVQVLGARVTGFTAATGTAYKGMFDANRTYNADSTPAGLVETRQRIKALEDALRTHGIIT